MTKSRLARRLGLDGNPLRRRTDKTATCLAGLLVALFLAGAPVLAVAAAGWAARAGAAGHQAARSWRQPPAVSPQAAPVPAALAPSGYSRAPARQTAPDGRLGAAAIPVNGHLAAGHTAPLWAGAAAGRPAARRALRARPTTARLDDQPGRGEGNPVHQQATQVRKKNTHDVGITSGGIRDRASDRLRQQRGPQAHEILADPRVLPGPRRIPAAPRRQQPNQIGRAHV